MTKTNSIKILTADFIHVDALHLFHAQETMRMPSAQRHFIKPKTPDDIHALVARDNMLMAVENDTAICGMISVKQQGLPPGRYDAPLSPSFRQARGDIVELNSFVVGRDYRGNGLGDHLILNGLDHAKNKGFKHAFARVAVDNRGGFHSFQQAGFEPVGETQRDNDPSIKLAVLMRGL